MMKRFSRIVALLLLSLMIAAVGLPATAESGDTSPPVIESVTIQNHTTNKLYTENDTLSVKIKATDNFGINYIFFRIVNNATGEEKYYDLSAPDNADEYTIEVPLQHYNSGDYYFATLEVWDPGSNNAVYETALDPYFCFCVENSSYNTGAPKVSGISISPKSGNSQKTKFTYTVTVEPFGNSGIKTVRLLVGGLVAEQSTRGCDIELLPTGKPNEYSATFSFHERTLEPMRNMELLYISVETTDGQIYLLTPADSKLTWIENHFTGYTSKDLAVVLTDIVEDNDAPTLVSWKYPASVVYTPDTMTMQITASDKTSAPNSVDVWLQKEGDDTVSIPGATTIVKSGKTTVFDVGFEFPKYYVDGILYVGKIRVSDNAGNSTTYSVEDGTLEKKTIEVIDGASGDYYTSTTDAALLDIVRGAAEEKGKTVLINVTEKNPIVPKEVFEIIAGKDVTVIFEKMYANFQSTSQVDDGIEWVMYGKHVDKAKAKDINAYVKIVEESWSNLAAETDFKKPKNEKKDRFIRFIFANNGELPGKATIRFKPGFTLRNFTNANDMRLYYLNDETGDISLIQKNIKTEKTGYFHFNITHNSSYALVGEYAAKDTASSSGSNTNSVTSSNNTSKEETSTPVSSNSDAANEMVSEETEDTDDGNDNSTTVIIIVSVVALLLIGGAAAFFIIYKKKSAKDQTKTLE